jgi:hypothetical protein
MGALKGIRAYLGGPIEFDRTDLNWRTEPTNVLSSRFGINVFDPFADPKQRWVSVLQDAKSRCDTDEMAKVAKNFVRKDLSMVDRSDILISCLPEGVPTCGSHHEIFVSNNAKKPTLLVCTQGRQKLPIWYYGFISPEFMFGSWDDLYGYLSEVDDGKHKANNRWWFVYNMI